MKYLKEDLFTAFDQKLVDKANCLVCTTNCIVKKDGCLTMGKGIAAEFKKRYPSIDKHWGRDQLIWNRKNCGDIKPKVHLYQVEDLTIIGFPTKINWRDNSSIKLITSMLLELKMYFRMPIYYHSKCLIPKLGCSNGGLEWKDVRPVMEEYLGDNFVCCLNE